MSREHEDPYLFSLRWAMSMGHTESPPRPTSKSDLEAKQAREAAHDREADAWSPSRAREALRAWASIYIRADGSGSENAKEAADILDAGERAIWGKTAFKSFCIDNIGYCPL